MKFIFRIGMLSLLAIVMLGCGGNGGGILNFFQGNTPPTQNPFQGVYSGTYMASGNTSNVIGFTIDTNGNLSGSAIVGGSRIALTGNIDGVGQVTLGTNTGNLTVDHLASSAPTQALRITGSIGSVTNPEVTLLLNPTPPGSGATGFAGDYTGTVMTPSQQIEVYSFKIGPTGTVSGSCFHYVGQTLYKGSVTGTVNSNGGMRITINSEIASSEVFTGQVTLATKHLTGTMTDIQQSSYALNFSQF